MRQPVLKDRKRRQRDGRLATFRTQSDSANAKNGLGGGSVALELRLPEQPRRYDLLNRALFGALRRAYAA
ncbi:hypothetical protein GCM10025771_32270 [Niveibacterium umoris]